MVDVDRAFERIHTIPIRWSCVETLPENFSGSSRKEELLNWLFSLNHDRNFIIIDDDKSLNDLPPHFKERLVLTNGSVGLTEALADQTIALLKNDRNRVSA